MCSPSPLLVCGYSHSFQMVDILSLLLYSRECQVPFLRWIHTACHCSDGTAYDGLGSCTDAYDSGLWSGSRNPMSPSRIPSVLSLCQNSHCEPSFPTPLGRSPSFKTSSWASECVTNLHLLGWSEEEGGSHSLFPLPLVTNPLPGGCFKHDGSHPSILSLEVGAKQVL